MSERSFLPVTFGPIGRADLDDRLIAWGHRMDPVRRPTKGWSHGLRHGGDLVAVVATDPLIRPQVAGLSRREAVELSRLCAARPDLCRVALRLWRAFVFPALCETHGFRWALSYQDAALHSGGLYRFDGWTRLARSRSGVDPRTGRRGRNKVVWGWCASVAGEQRQPSFAGDGLLSDARYVDEAFPGPALQPLEPKKRARMNQIIGIADGYIYPQLVWGMYVELVSKMARGESADASRVAIAREKAPLCLKVLSDLLGDGPWLCGDCLTLADIYVAPMLDYFLMVPEGQEMLSETPNLVAWWRHMGGRKSIQITSPTT